MNRTQPADYVSASLPDRPVGLEEFGLKFYDRDTDFTKTLVLTVLDEAFLVQHYTVAADAMATRFPKTDILMIGGTAENLTGIERTNYQPGASLSPVKVDQRHSPRNKVVDESQGDSSHRPGHECGRGVMLAQRSPGKD